MYIFLCFYDRFRVVVMIEVAGVVGAGTAVVRLQFPRVDAEGRLLINTRSVVIRRERRPFIFFLSETLTSFLMSN